MFNKLEKLGYSKKYEKKHNLGSLKRKDVKALLEDRELKMFTELLVSEKNIAYLDAFHYLIQAKEKFGLEPKYIGLNGMYGLSDEKLAAMKEKREKKEANTIEKTAKVTGWTMEKVNEELDFVKQAFDISPLLYYEKQLYKMSHDEIGEYIEAEKKEDERCREWVKGETGWSDYKLDKHISMCRMTCGINPGYYYPSRCWEMDKKTLKTFANQRDSGRLRAKYNDSSVNKYLSNKYLFNKKFGDLTGRKYWKNRDTSYKKFLAFIDGVDMIFCKPVDLSHATGVKKIKVEGDLKALYDNLMAQPTTLVEEFVQQHHEMNEFYDKSVNTVRVFCLIDHGEFIPFASFVRFGAYGVADNIVAGGVGCGVDVKTGIIDTPAIDQYHVFHDTHPISGKKFEGFQIPNWDKVMEVAEKGLRMYDGLNYAGWDIAVCEDKAVLIEGNSYPSLGTYQMFYGFRHEGKKKNYREYLKKESVNTEE